MRVRLFSDIGHVMTKIDWEGMYICTSSRRKLKYACTVHCWGLKTTNERVKPATAGPVGTENAMFILFCLRK